MNNFVNTNYQEQQAARKERYENKAEALRESSAATYQKAKTMANGIPFGQPILVGHYSETRDRNYRKRIQKTFKKSFEELDKAEHYENKAHGAGTAGVSSTDPEAILKLKIELEGRQEAQEIMKAVNRVIRMKKLTVDEQKQKIIDDGIMKEGALLDGCFEPSHSGGFGFASYALTNNNATISRIKKRILELEQIAETSEDDFAFDNGDFSINIEEGRIIIDFSGGKPSEEVRTLIKSNGFKWSRYQTAWVRKVTANALSALEHRVLPQLQALESIY